MKRFIIYSRRSKVDKRGNQHTHDTAEWEVKNYLETLERDNIPYEIVEHVKEDISGYGYYTKRPLFTDIVKRCKADRGLTLLASKCDRVARDSWTGSELLKTINMVIATNPDADDLQLQIMFAVSEKEVKNTSDRFKAMYKAKKARCEREGVKFEWGASADKYQRNPSNPNKRNRHEAVQRIERLREPLRLIVQMLRKPTYKAIAEALTKGNYALPSGAGGVWSASQAQRSMERLGISRN